MWWRVAIGAVLSGVLVGCQAGRAVHPNPDRAVRACHDALEDSLAPPSGKSGFEVLADGCKELYVERGCRDAFTDAVAAPPAERMTRIYEACRDAYCPVLEEPPDVCHQDHEIATSYDRMLSWSELNRAILARDLGGRRASRISGELSALGAIANEPKQ